MKPDFNKKTIDTLGKRAAYRCSNPDCRIVTVGPNSDPKKSTSIGEAAHIFGARPGSKRYKREMTDIGRAAITNAILLCCNCHKLIDTDEKRYSSAILFKWRETHEKYVNLELGTSSDRIEYEIRTKDLLPFEEYPPHIRRIVIDKPDGWEWSLTAELMRHLNAPFFRMFKDLRRGLYAKPQVHIYEDEALDWINERLHEIPTLIRPLEGLINSLNASWGAPDEAGDAHEIHHICKRIKDALEQILMYEEQLCFTNLPYQYNNVVGLLKSNLSINAEKISEIPESLDEILSLINTDHGGTKENPYMLQKTISFEFSDKWEKQFNRELKRAVNYETEDNIIKTIFQMILIFFVLWIIF